MQRAAPRKTPAMPWPSVRGGWFLLLFFLAFSFSSKAQNLSLNLKQIPLEKVFREIEKQVPQRFVYTREMMDRSLPVSIRVQSQPLEEALQIVFADQPLTFSIEEQLITVRFRAAPPAKTGKDVRGRVTGDDGAVLGGATIHVKDQSKTTGTDENGRFAFDNLKEDAVLIVSNIGYAPREVSVTGQAFLNVVLSLSVTALDETIVIAYGQTTNRLNTGNVTKVKGEDISRQPVSNPLAALQGRVPGLVITQSSGLPGSSFTVQLRGRTALDLRLTDDQPLFIVDGVPYAPNNGYLNLLTSAFGTPSNLPGVVSPGGLSPLNNINPADIESIEVLKDADATAIYGSRGANGVILITTKQGKGKNGFTLNVQNGWSKVARTVDLLLTPEYLNMRREAFVNDNVVPDASNAFDLLLWDTTRYTDFKKLLIGGTARLTDVQGTFTGGNTTTQFLLGGSYRHESTVYPGELNDKRGAAHLNIAHATAGQRLRLQFSTSYTTDRNNLIAADLAGLINRPPNLLVYDAAGKLAWNEGGVITGYDNPLALLNQTYTARSQNLISNLLLNYKLVPSLSLRLNAGYNSVLLNEQQANPATAQNPLTGLVRSASFASNLFRSWIVEPQAEWTRSGTKARINGLLGATLQDQSNDVATTAAAGYLDDALLNSLSGATSITGSRANTQYRYAALFGRLTYNWESRYVINLSARRDGSSRFGPGKQFANFFAAGGAWLFSEEAFVSKALPFVSFGKLRGSYGTTGNDKIANYQYLDTWGATANTYQDAAALAPLKLFNPDYRWEKTTKLETALDLGFIKDRLLFSIVYYRNRSSNQLIQYRLPTTTGFTSVTQNLPALVQNKGIELVVTSNNITGNVFKWNTSANLTIPRTKLLRFPGLATSAYASQYVEGESLNLIYRLKATGIDPGTGIYTAEDRNGDGRLTPLDYVPAGRLDPVYYGGLQNTLRYKTWQLDVFVQYTKETGLNYLGASGIAPGFAYNLPTALDQSGTTKPLPIQRLTQALGSSAYNAFNNAFLLSNAVYNDASFVRLKNVALSYNLEEKLTAKAGLKSVRLYVNGQNLFTLTSYEGGDPETQNYLRLPPLRTIVCGLQITL